MTARKIAIVTIGLIIAIIAATLMLQSCDAKKDNRIEIGRVAIDKKFTPAHQEIKTEYDYEYDIMHGEFVLVPFMFTEQIDDHFEVLYRITFTDGTQKDEWSCVTEDEYQACMIQKE